MSLRCACGRFGFLDLALNPYLSMLHTGVSCHPLRSTSPRGVFGYGVVEFPKEVDDEMMPVRVTFQADGDGIYPVKTSAPGWWDPGDFKWEYLSERERQLVLDEMCPEGVIQ